MKDLSLIIPAKNESDSLPIVLEELKKFDCKIIVILESSDVKTINSIKDFNCELIYQSDNRNGDQKVTIPEIVRIFLNKI